MTNNQYIYFHSFLFLSKSQTFEICFMAFGVLFMEGKDVISEKIGRGYILEMLDSRRGEGGVTFQHTTLCTVQFILLANNQRIKSNRTDTLDSAT